MSSSSPSIERKINFPDPPSFIDCKEKETELFKQNQLVRSRSGSINKISWNLGADARAGFTFKHCMWAVSSANTTIKCPHHGELKLLDLIPDVVWLICVCQKAHKLLLTFTWLNATTETEC